MNTVSKTFARLFAIAGCAALLAPLAAQAAPHGHQVCHIEHHHHHAVRVCHHVR